MWIRAMGKEDDQEDDDCSSKTSYGRGHGRWLALAYCAPTFESTRTLIPGPWSPRASCTRGPGTLGPEAI